MTEGVNTKQPSSSARVARNVIGGFLAGLGWTVLFGGILATSHWVRLAPLNANISRGEIFEQNEHGSIVYFNGYQHFAELFSICGGAAIFFFGVAISARRKFIHRRGHLSWRGFRPNDVEGVLSWVLALGIAAGLFVVNSFDPSLFNWGYEQLTATSVPRQ